MRLSACHARSPPRASNWPVVPRGSRGIAHFLERRALVSALLWVLGMLPRDALVSVPDHSFARRVAVATGITTAIAIGGALAVILCSSRATPPAILEDVEAPKLASFYAGPAAALATPAQIATAAVELRTYAYETYPKWVATNPDRECPRHLLELNAFDPTLHAVDPWGTPYQLVCGAQITSVPSTRSAGPDRAFDTADDLSSNSR